MTPSNRLIIGDTEIKPGETLSLNLKVSENVLGANVSIPLKVIRSKKAGPTVLVIAGIHGDEMNGVGIVRTLMQKSPKLLKGSLILIPIVNIFGFESNDRYLPDRRDLNRCFPGNSTGTLGSRLAHFISNEIITKADAIIDLHTAAFPRTNFPQIRADLSNKDIAQLSQAFDASLTVDSKGEPTTLRGWASRSGVPTLCYEAGETNRFEAQAIKYGLVGIRNVLKSLSMISGNHISPKIRLIVSKSTWVRSNSGGILQLKIKPGDLLRKGDVIASCFSITTMKHVDIRAPYKGIAFGLTTRPTVKPGEPVCNFARVTEKDYQTMSKNEETLNQYE